MTNIARPCSQYCKLIEINPNKNFNFAPFMKEKCKNLKEIISEYICYFIYR
jgi:hypothetical protein